MENKETFHYTYSAKQQEEIKAIRNKYAAPEEDKLAQLRRLDAGVTQKATAVSLVVGIIGALILGLGMSLLMSELAEMLGMNKEGAMPAGIIIGAMGMIMVGCAYPLYNRITKKERKKIAPEILRLTDELMQ